MGELHSIRITLPYVLISFYRVERLRVLAIFWHISGTDTHIKYSSEWLTNIFICAILRIVREDGMKGYSSKEVIALLKADGWYEVNVVGSHHQYKHPTKKGRTTVKHPDKDIPMKTLKRIEEQSGLKFR